MGCEWWFFNGFCWSLVAWRMREREEEEKRETVEKE